MFLSLKSYVINFVFILYFRLSRAGAVAEYVNGYVLFCGGRNGQGVHSDCLVYDPTKDMWSEHTRMTRYDYSWYKFLDKIFILWKGNFHFTINFIMNYLGLEMKLQALRLETRLMWLEESAKELWSSLVWIISIRWQLKLLGWYYPLY